ncbi:hypothetical protein [Chitinasiproducens palmae]|uniref:DUF4148 domain-containing protein n=1 Tax=Chitinasiproducens palmae TaxID=1770053 RepID=A0A1H2PM71_9BURK|nr:hypothetical protein [Chitinasiproducens palmae]SDV47636.1 hypothetical protein SAMN05216551_103174 [Chitinasiproducens palmae]
MKKTSIALLMALCGVSGAAVAQDAGMSPAPNTVISSTDPARAADIEQRAQALQSRQGMSPVSDRSYRPSSHRHHRPMHRQSQRVTPDSGNKQ